MFCSSPESVFLFLFNFFLSAGPRGPLKKTAAAPAHEDERGRRSEAACACLRGRVIVSCFLSKQEKTKKKKGEGTGDGGGQGGLEKCCLDVCWPEVQLRPSDRPTDVTLPDRKNRPIQGVALSGIVGGVIFITFTKARRGRRGQEGAGGMLFPAVDTGLDHFFFAQKNSEEQRETSHLVAPPSPPGWQPDTIVRSV